MKAFLSHKDESKVEKSEGLLRASNLPSSLSCHQKVKPAPFKVFHSESPGRQFGGRFSASFRPALESRVHGEYSKEAIASEVIVRPCR